MWRELSVNNKLKREKYFDDLKKQKIVELITK